MTRGRTVGLASAALSFALALAACKGSSGPGASAVREVEQPPIGEADTRLPRVPGTFGPSLAEVGARHATDSNIDGTHLTDVDTCGSCHPDVVAMWQSSTHAFSSFNNPIYRVDVDQFRADHGNDPSQHCAGCHDIALMVDDAMPAEIRADDIRAHSGVTCRVCHGIESATFDGNGSWVMTARRLEMPDLADPASVEAHKATASRDTVGIELCASCHRGFLSPDMGNPAHLLGQDEPTAWRSSAWAGNGMGRIDEGVTKKDCIACHMAREPASTEELGAKEGTVASHRFLGGHTWLGAMRDDDDRIARNQAFLRGVASIDVAAARSGGTLTLPAEGAPIAAGAAVELDVVVRNLGAGHRFPGGVLDIQDTWIELDVRDARGRLIARSGAAHAEDPDDTEAHVLRSLVLDEHGKILEEHEIGEFRAPLANHTVGPRDAIAVRYGFTVPAKLRDGDLPLRVDARLRHRSRTLAMQRAVCRGVKTPAGRAFQAATPMERDTEILDPCVTQPITAIAETAVWLGDGWEAAEAEGGIVRAPRWRRLWEHGMAMLKVVQERLEEARPSLEAALAEIERGAADGSDPDHVKHRAMVLTMLGALEGRAGRTDAALAWIAQARALVPEPAALDAYSAEALAQVWRWQEALAPAQAATKKAPGNIGAWILLARVLGSLHDDRGALAAATAGLALNPRDPDLLRSQAVALRTLGEPGLAERALEAYARFRTPDAAQHLRMACAAGGERCAREREMIHSHAMIPSKR